MVLDFPANTSKQRTWLKSIAEEINASHRLIYLEVSDAQCLEQIAKRQEEQPQRATFDTEEMFYEVTKFFEAPKESEGLNIELVKAKV